MEKAPAALAAAAAVGAAAVAGARNGPQNPTNAIWYAALSKPAAVPPGPVIGAVWTVLELLLATIGYRLLRAPATRARGLAVGGWATTLLGLAGFPWLFFGRKRLGASTVAAATMFAGAAAMATAGAQAPRPAGPKVAALSAPLLSWLAFATLLAADLYRRNPRLSRD